MPTSPFLPVKLSLAAAVVAALGGSAAAHGPAHSAATVNDPRSHGQLGDAFLSLDEVIRLNQRLLTREQLSPAEAAQIWGFGPDIAWANIDFTITPTITLERDLTPILDEPHGLLIAGANGRPVIEIGATRGFVVDANQVDFATLLLRGGATAIDLRQPNAVYGTTITDVVFEGQSSRAVRVVLDEDGGRTRFEADRCTFQGPATAIEIFDSGANRSGQLTFRRLDIRGSVLGIGVHLGPGGSMLASVDRCVITGAADAIVFDRSTPSDTRQLTLDALHLTVSGGANGLAVQGHPAIADALTLRMLDLGASQQALRLWPQGSLLGARIEDSRLAGDLDLLTGPAPAGITVTNARIANGALRLTSSGGSLRVEQTVLDGVSTTASGTAGPRLDGCRFTQGSIQGGASAPVTVSASYLGGVSLGAHTVVTNALQAPQLGSADATPLSVVRGGRVELVADLPPGLVGFWIVGVAETNPIVTPLFRLYYFQSAHVVLPLPVRNQDRLPVPVPNSASLAGWDFVAQLAVLPDPGLVAPQLSLPPGRRFVVR